jgi:hypothetical protein
MIDSSRVAAVTTPRQKYERSGLLLVVIGLALLLVYLPVAIAAFVLAAVALAGAVRGWPWPRQPPEPEERLTRKARRYVEVDPEWSVDFLEPDVGLAVPDPIPFSGIEQVPTWLGTIPLRNAQRSPGVDLNGIGAELAFYREDGTPVHERIAARWSNNPFPELRRQLEPEVRRLPASGEPEPIDVVARPDKQGRAYVHTAEAARGTRRLPLDPARYWVRVRIRNAPDEPVAWYRCEVPLMTGLELRGPSKRPPSWASRPRRRAAGSAKAAPRKKQRSPGS